MDMQTLVARQQALLDEAKTAEREFTAEEQSEFDELQRQIEEIKSAPTVEPQAEVVVEPEVDDNKRALEERARIREIEEICESFDMDARSFIDNNNTVEEVRKAVMDNLIRTKAPVSTGTVEVTVSEQDKFRAAAADALVMRSGISIEKPAEGARELMGLSLRDLAIESLSAEGEVGLNRKSSDELYSIAQRQFYNPTAAFPAILDNAIQKAIVEGHKKVAVTFDRWTKKGTLSDFKINNNNYVMGSFGEFTEVPEGGEIKHDTLSLEHKPTRQLKTYGKQFTLTRQAFINDDITLITKLPANAVASARKTINKQCYQLLLGSAPIYDGVSLFHATHKNVLGTGTGVTKEVVQNMIMALQTQKDEFGDPIIVRPAKFIMPVGMGFDAYTLFNSPTIHAGDNTQAVNPLLNYVSQMEIIEDPTINVLCGDWGNVMPWFMTGAAEDTDFIEVDYLNGQEIPTIRRMETPGTLGFVWDMYLDWGISVMDYRGAVKNPGVAIASPLA